MWLILSITSLLIRAIVGNLEIDGLTGQSNFRNQNDNELGSEIKKSTADLSQVWSKETTTPEKEKKQSNLKTTVTGALELKESTNSDGHENKDSMFNEEAVPDVKTVSKRSEIASASSWLYLPTRHKMSSLEGFQDISQEKKSPSFNPWGGKRTPFLISDNIRRPIRVPFNSWGGKRAKEYLNRNIEPQTKRNRFLFDKNGKRTLLEEFEVKRRAAAGRGDWKVPFNSWGGKRSQETDDTDRKQLMFLMDNEITSNKNSGSKDTFSKSENIEHVEKKRMNLGKSRDSKTRVRFSSWGGKRKDPEYQTLSNMKNETTNDYTAEEDIDENNWLISMPNKRTEHIQFRRVSFNPWGGKRSSKAYAFRFADDYSGIPADSAKGRKVFFPWGG